MFDDDSKLYQKTSAGLLMIAAATLPIFFAVSAVSLSLAAFVWLLFSGRTHLVSTIQQSAIARWSLLVFGCILLSALFLRAPASLAFKNVVSYREFLIIPLVMTVFAVVPAQYTKNLMNILIASLGFVVLLSYLDAYSPLPFSNATEVGAVGDHFIFTHHITQNVMSSFLVLLLLVKSTEPQLEPKWKYLCYAFAALVIIDVLFLVKGRTGVLTLAFNLLVFVCYKLSVKQRWWAVGLVGVFVALLLSTNNPLKNLVQQTQREVTAYQATGQDTSAGLRLAFWQDTWGKIKANPIVGYGAGSYRNTYDLQAKNPDKPGYEAGWHHPHNELLLIWFEAGIAGALAYMMFIGSLFVTAFKAHHVETKVLRLGTAGTLLIYSMLDTPIYNHLEGMFFCILIGVFFAFKPAEHQ